VAALRAGEGPAWDGVAEGAVATQGVRDSENIKQAPIYEQNVERIPRSRELKRQSIQTIHSYEKG
jgi:hypothetical protein